MNAVRGKEEVCSISILSKNIRIIILFPCLHIENIFNVPDDIMKTSILERKIKMLFIFLRFILLQYINCCLGFRF